MKNDLAESLKGTSTKGIDILEVMKVARKQYLEEQKQEMLASRQEKEAIAKILESKVKEDEVPVSMPTQKDVVVAINAGRRGSVMGLNLNALNIKIN